jgi:hypothetical protein
MTDTQITAPSGVPLVTISHSPPYRAVLPEFPRAG